MIIIRNLFFVIIICKSVLYQHGSSQQIHISPSIISAHNLTFYGLFERKYNQIIEDLVTLEQ